MNYAPPHLMEKQTLEFSRFLKVAALLALAAILLTAPGFSYAAPFNGTFGPDSGLVTNTSNSLKGWWKALATWGLWLSIAGFLFSILFAGGRWWWIPVAVFLICLFGEPAVTKVAEWASLNDTGGK